jgi:hypothetical protein
MLLVEGRFEQDYGYQRKDNLANLSVDVSNMWVYFWDLKQTKQNCSSNNTQNYPQDRF